MDQTNQCIQNLANAFSKGICPRELYVTSLESLVRLAIAEHVAAPILGAQADVNRVSEIWKESKKAS